MARRQELRSRLVFLEDYNMNIARYLVQGVDVWLNTPTRPHEGSGTSGMKAAANGVLNLSTLDGWWDEAYTSDIGWAIGRGEVYDDHNLQDHIESNAIYHLLEKEIVPLFYDRGSDGLPRGWIKKMKASMKATCPVFNTHRMLQEYTEKYYIPACERYDRLSTDHLAPVKTLAEWKARIHQHWSQVQISHVESDISGEIQVGTAGSIWAEIYLGELTPGDVRVELYYGRIEASGEILDPQIVEMQSKQNGANGQYAFVGNLVCRSSGQHGFTVRVVPKQPELVDPFEMGLVLWG